jgi:hypothetical protein
LDGESEPNIRFIVPHFDHLTSFFKPNCPLQKQGFCPHIEQCGLWGNTGGGGGKELTGRALDRLGATRNNRPIMSECVTNKHQNNMFLSQQTNG